MERRRCSAGNPQANDTHGEPVLAIPTQHNPLWFWTYHWYRDAQWAWMEPQHLHQILSVIRGGNCGSEEGFAYQILSSLVSTCSTCEYGVDPVAANRSVDILARVLLGYCYQTEQIIYNATGWNSSLAVDYATIWKLTLMNYNAGPGCVYDAVANAFKTTKGPIRWPDIVAHTSGDQCLRGLYYAQVITAKYFDFPPNQ